MVRKSKPSSGVRVLDRQNDTSSPTSLQNSGGTKGLQNQEEEAEKEIIEVDLGLDISTSVVGVCVLDAASGKMLHLSHQKLTKYTDEYDKADNFDSSWIDLNWKIRKVYIEEAAKKFSPGFSSADTIMTLGRFNGILSYQVYSWTGIKPVMVNVRSARSRLSIKIDYKDKTKDTKTKVFEVVSSRNPSFPWLTHTAKTGKFKGQIVYDKVNQDMADAWVIARGGQLLGL